MNKEIIISLEKNFSVTQEYIEQKYGFSFISGGKSAFERIVTHHYRHGIKIRYTFSEYDPNPMSGKHELIMDPNITPKSIQKELTDIAREVKKLDIIELINKRVTKSKGKLEGTLAWQ